MYPQISKCNLHATVQSFLVEDAHHIQCAVVVLQVGTKRLQAHFSPLWKCNHSEQSNYDKETFYELFQLGISPQGCEP